MRLLESLSVEGFPLAPLLAMDLATRANVITGDNALGKTLLLEAAYACATNETPRLGGRPGAHVRGRLAPDSDYESTYEEAFDGWTSTYTGTALDPNVIYARVDGSFDVYDPAIHFAASRKDPAHARRGGFYRFSRTEVLDGLQSDGDVLCNGLIRDWTLWQATADSPRWAALRRVLDALSPSAEERIAPAASRRIAVSDKRDHPHVKMPYGDVAIVHTSAAFRRVVSLAYLIVWAWFEHLETSRLIGAPPNERLILLIDEVEAHLHPQWQRRIVRSLFTAIETLARPGGDTPPPRVQVIATTHAPLVLAAMEPWFDDERDALFTLNLGEDRQVRLDRSPWYRRGDVLGWMLDPAVFGLQQARSREAEIAIEAAEAYMRGDRAALPDELSSFAAIDARLRELLSGSDHFWPRWVTSAVNKAS